MKNKSTKKFKKLLFKFETCCDDGWAEEGDLELAHVDLKVRV